MGSNGEVKGTLFQSTVSHTLSPTSQDKIKSYTQSYGPSLYPSVSG